MKNIIEINQVLTLGECRVYCSEFSKVFIEKDSLAFTEEINSYWSFAQSKDLSFTKEVLKINGNYFLMITSLNESAVFVFSNQLGHETFLMKNCHFQFSGDGGELFLSLLNQSNEENISEIHQIIRRYKLMNPFEDQLFIQVDEKISGEKQKLVQLMNDYRPGLFEKMSDVLLTLSAHYALIRIHLLKFLAILPSLEHDDSGESVRKSFLESINRLIADYELNRKREKSESKYKKHSSTNKLLPPYLFYLFKVIKITATPLPPKFLAWFLRYTTSYMAKRFIAGKDIDSSIQTIEQISNTGRCCTLDQLGELVVSSSEANNYYKLVCENIRGLGKLFAGKTNSAGIYLAHVSVKVTALCHDIRAHDHDYCFRQISPLLKNILLLAKKEKVFVHIDAEHYHVRDMVFAVYSKILLEDNELKEFEQTGIVIQAYLRDVYEHFQDVLILNQKRNIAMPIRLVKGAYWDAETIYTEAHQHLSFQFLNKDETDGMFRLLIYECLKNYNHFQLCLASHNYHDHLFAIELRKSHFPQAKPIEHQCLHMTYESLSLSLVKMGYPVRNYLPIGDLIVGMGYLVRRIMENSSQVGILNISRSHKDLSRYESCFSKIVSEEKNYSYQLKLNMNDQFIPQSPFPFYGNKNVKYLESKVNQYVNELSKDWTIDSYTDLEGVYFTLEDLIKNREHKRENSEFNRDQLLASLLRLSNLLLFNRIRLAAMMVLEAQKSIEEAFADVDEGIDFINFYIRSKDLNENSQIPVVPNIVIAPWNFPLAIPLGMSIGSIVAGRETILKPSELTPKICAEVVKIARQAGLTEKYLKLFIGGKNEGAELLEKVDFDSIIFTGSRAVGVELYKKYTKQINREGNFKRVIAELGGKNAIVVSDNSELDETIAGVLQSCFGHAGQKCSACSRVFVDEKIMEKFKKRFIEAVNEIQVGKAKDFSTFLNPVINQDSVERIKSIIQTIKENKNQDPEFEILVDRSNETYENTSAIGPFVFQVGEKTLQDKESYAHQEIFGPVVVISSFKNLEEAVKNVNAVEYALTCGVFTQSDDDSEYLVENIEAGNIYVNRSCTGARVGIEPFGGFKMSGTGPKAGSYNYIKYLNNNKENKVINSIAVIENTEFDEIFKKDSSDSIELLNWLRPSLLTFSNRHDRLKNLLKIVLSNAIKIFDFNQVQSQNFDKELVRVMFDLKEFNQKDNFFIPGQKSFNTYSLDHKFSLAIINQTNPSLELVHFICSSLLTGTPLLLLNFSSSVGVFALTDYIRKAGFSYYNYLEMNLSKIDFKNVISQYEFDLIFSQMSLEDEREFRNMILESHGFTSGLPKFYNQNDKFDYTALFQEKAIAINTVRHGANIELT
ncbi:proline dehydrogenase family protein [Bacteriovoracaceae bacterium]|nr:proline dehydrogenase family protein [Bacteriovoracaceae bacterium]